MNFEIRKMKSFRVFLAIAFISNHLVASTPISSQSSPDEDLDLDYTTWFSSSAGSNNNSTLVKSSNNHHNNNNSSKMAASTASAGLSTEQRNKMIAMLVRNQLKKELRKLKSSMTDSILEEVINYYGKRLDGADALKGEVETLNKRVGLLSHNLNTLGQNFKTISKSHRNLVDLVRNNIANMAVKTTTTSTTTTTDATTSNALLAAAVAAAAARLNSSNLKKKSIESVTNGSSEANKLKQELLNDLETKYSNLLNEKLVEIIINNFKSNESMLAATENNNNLSDQSVEETKLAEIKSSDCQDLRKAGFVKDGVYTVTLAENKSINVFCEFQGSTGWTLLQRRFDGSVDFYQNWNAYKNGFGNLISDGEFWLGLENMHDLTKQHNYSLQIIMTDWKNEDFVAEYALFRVNDEAHKYQLELGAYLSNSSTAGDSMGGENSQAGASSASNGGNGGESETTQTQSHNHMLFSTFDSDNDMRFYDNCAQIFKSGWWFNACFQANLNGLYYKYSSNPTSVGGQSAASSFGRNVRLVKKEEHAQLKFLRNGIHWNSIDFYKSLKSTKLRLKRA